MGSQNVSPTAESVVVEQDAPPTAYAPPSMDEARQHRDRMRPFQILGGTGRSRYSLWRTPALQLGALGIGVGLYFKVLKALACVLAFISVLFGVGMILNWLAFKEVQQKDIYHPLTAFTLGSMTIDPAFPGTEKFKLVLGQTVSKKDVLLFLSTLDSVGMLVFLWAVYFLWRQQGADTEDISKANTTLGDYTVQVDCLPRDCTPEALREHFGRFGQVFDIVIARNDGSLVHMLAYRKKYASQLETVEACIAKYGTKVHYQKSKDYLEKEMGKAEAEILRLIDKTDFDCIAGFVTFDTQSAHCKCLMAYPDSAWGYLTQPKALRFHGKKRLRVRAAPEPDNCVWENFEYGWFTRQLLKFGTALVTAALLAVSLSLAVSARSYASKLPQAISCDSSAAQGTLLCSSLWDLNNTVSSSDPVRLQVEQYKAEASGTLCKAFTKDGVFVENVTAVAAARPKNSTAPLPLDTLGACAALTCYGCYCGSLKVSKLVEKNGELANYCKDFFLNQALTASTQVMAIGGVAAINMVLYVLLPALSRMEKHHLMTSTEAASAEKVFVAQLLNAGIIAMLVYAHLDYVPLHAIRKVAFSGLYRDFELGWYSDVGVSIIYTLGIQTVLPFIISGIFIFAAALARFFLASRQVTQRDLNKLMECPEFHLSERYGQLLTLIFITFIFCAGIPLLLPLLMVALTLTYWMDKATLLWWSKAPAQYDATMAEMLLRVLPWAVWTHSAIAAWIFGGLPSAPLPSISSTVHDQVDAKPPAQVDIFTRLTVVNALPPLVLWVVLTIFLLARPFTAALGSLASLFWRSNKVAAEESDMTLRDALREDRLQGLLSYNRNDNPRYHLIERLDAFRTLDKLERARLLQGLDASLLPPPLPKTLSDSPSEADLQELPQESFQPQPATPEEETYSQYPSAAIPEDSIGGVSDIDSQPGSPSTTGYRPKPNIAKLKKKKVHVSPSVEEPRSPPKLENEDRATAELEAFSSVNDDSLYEVPGRLPVGPGDIIEDDAPRVDEYSSEVEDGAGRTGAVIEDSEEFPPSPVTAKTKRSPMSLLKQRRRA